MNAAVARQHEAWDETQHEMQGTLKGLRQLVNNDELFPLIEEVISAACMTGYCKVYSDARSDVVRHFELMK